MKSIYSVVLNSLLSILLLMGLSAHADEVIYSSFNGDLGFNTDSSFNGDLGFNTDSSFNGDLGFNTDSSFNGDLGFNTDPSWNGDLGFNTDSSGTSTTEVTVGNQNVEIERKKVLASRFIEPLKQLDQAKNRLSFQNGRLEFEAHVNSFRKILKKCQNSITTYDSGKSRAGYVEVLGSCSNREMFTAWFKIKNHYLEVFRDSNPGEPEPYICKDNGNYQYSCYDK